MNQTTNTPNAPTAKKKISGKRNKAAGHSFERTTVNTLKEMGFPHLCTTRSESRGRDAQKIDVMNKDEGTNGRFPYNIQCKNVVGVLKYAKVLAELPENGSEINVVLHNQTKRSAANFITVGQYAFLTMANFFRMVQKIQNLSKGFELLRRYQQYIPIEDAAKVASELEALGL